MTLRVPFWKLESIGNDFPLLHLEDVRGAWEFLRHEATEGGSPESSELGFEGFLFNLARAICDRKFGVGGDGLLAAERTEQGLLLRMFNPDGTEDFCGNGLRCAAVHAVKMDWVGSEFQIEHLGRSVKTSIADDVVLTTIGRATYDPASVPLEAGVPEIFDGPIYWGEGIEIKGSALTTGSTHVIVPASELPNDEEILNLGPKIETFELYPARTSVIWVKELEPNHLKIRIWERGVGETLGCGTGSSAAAADYLRRRGGGGTVRVDNPGGTVQICMDAWDSPITVKGTAFAVFEGEFNFTLH